MGKCTRPQCRFFHYPQGEPAYTPTYTHLQVSAEGYTPTSTLGSPQAAGLIPGVQTPVYAQPTQVLADLPVAL